jgi:hypothetical protein
MVKYFVLTLFKSEESLGARRHFAIASCGVRQLPFLEMRSLSVVRSTHVVSDVTAVAGVEVLKVNVETIAIVREIESQRKSEISWLDCEEFFEPLNMKVFLWTQHQP